MSRRVCRSASRPVRKSIRVRADVAQTFRVFTEEMDSGWPRTHHISSSPIRRAVVEGRDGGPIYTEQEDGSDCSWKSVLAWEPPHREQVNKDGGWCGLLGMFAKEAGVGS